MKQTVCENIWSEIRSSFTVTECLGNLFAGINIARERVRKYPLSGAKSPDESTDCVENNTLHKWLKNKKFWKVEPSAVKGNNSHAGKTL